MTQYCIICNKQLKVEGIYLCSEHTAVLRDIYSSGTELINNPSQNEHCHICGGYTEREMVNYDDWLYVCTKCLNDAEEKYYK